MLTTEELLQRPLTDSQRKALKEGKPLHGNTRCSVCGCKQSKDNRVRLSPEDGKPVCDDCWVKA